MTLIVHVPIAIIFEILCVFLKSINIYVFTYCTVTLAMNAEKEGQDRKQVKLGVLQNCLLLLNISR